jgi:molybdopterin synthase catalytic subunit
MGDTAPTGGPIVGADEWTELTSAPIPLGAIHEWLVRPDCGAQVVFTGTVRDHAEGRNEVTSLTYEAYEEMAVPKMSAIAAEIRRRWPAVRAVALVHRTGRLELGDCAVVAAVAAPHRPEAFEAARWAIDALKASVPIWKSEEWAGGRDWGTGAAPVTDPVDVR